MDILKHIFNNDISHIKDYYSQHQADNTQLLLAFSLYKVSKDAHCLKTLKHVVNACIHNDEFQENFARLIGTHIGLDYKFFNYMQDTDAFKNFLSEHHDEISGRISFWSEKMQSEKLKTYQALQFKDLPKFSAILDNVLPAAQQKNMPAPSLAASYPLEWRLFDLKKPISSMHQTALDEELLISVYTECKIKNLPLTQADSLIDTTKAIRAQFVEQTSQDKTTFSPLVACLHKDIISAITTPKNSGKELHCRNLWDDILKYDIHSVHHADFEKIKLPEHLQNVSSETTVRQAIWVLKQDGSAVFGGIHSLRNNDRDVHHIDLANGEDVVSAGTMLFSEDMTKVIAINPGSGHYRPTVESCLPMKNVMDNSSFDTSNTVICDFEWQPNIAPTRKMFSDAIINMRSKYIPTDNSTLKHTN